MAIITVVYYAFQLYSLMLIGYILMSWIPSARESSIGRMLEKVCEPYLGFFRKFIPPIGMIDISPIVGLIVLRFIERGVYKVLSYIIF